MKCIDILVQLKSQISRPVAFFSAVSTLVEHVVHDQVQPFIEYIKAFTGSDRPERTILNFSFTDFQRQVCNFILKKAMLANSWCSLCRD